jgi:ABC-type transport system involved in multi-copper enzyme maturation permease subunit
MSNAITVMKRELNAYFTSPIGYIFMIVFITISVGLYITPFFSFPVADMRPYFGNLPIMLAIFIPAITMRVWAQERSENTWEMLLTFPMKAWELVAGKFMAGVVFFALTLAATGTVPVMLASLGNPDNGMIITSYFGTLLLGALYLAIGIFFSGFFKDQILAYIITLLTCFAIFMVGTNFIASYIDGVISGLGTLLSSVVGLSDHYAAFTRGVIEVADILYFVAWTAIFLFLNVLFIDARSRAGAKVMFGTAVAVSLGIGLMGNWLAADTSLGRFDMTEDKVFTVSDASKNILGGIDTPVQVKLYITPKGEMPTGLTTLQQDIEDKLDELAVAAKGNLEFSVINLNASEAISTGQDEEQVDEEDAEQAVEKRLLGKGIQPFGVQAMSDDQVTNKLIYSSLGIAYKDKKEEIIPQILPQNLEELEYRLVSTVYKLTQQEKPVVALVAPKEAINIPPDLRRMYEQMGQPVPETDDPYEILEKLLTFEKYDVRRVEMTATSPLPEEYDTLLVVNPRALNERQRWEINRALVEGRSVVLAVQNYEWNYNPTPRGISIDSREEDPQVNPLLEHYGLGVSEDILMDQNNTTLNVQSGGNTLAGLMGTPVKLPMHILLTNDSMNDATSITSRLSTIFYLWGTGIILDDAKLAENGLNAQVLMQSSDNSWTASRDNALTAEAFDDPTEFGGPYPLMALVEGQFPDAYADSERPAWPVAQPQPGQLPPPPPPEEGDAPALTPAPGKLVLIGCSEMFRKDFLQAGNVDLFMNSVDAITLGDDLVNVRGRKPVDRLIDLPDKGTRSFWKLINYGLASSIIAVVGIGAALIRRRSRNAYTLAQSSTQQ